MGLQRHFLGWDAPLRRTVREFLFPDPLSAPADLGGTLVIVPTRQAGRRLTESLARFCARHGTALLSHRIVTPPFLVRPPEGNPRDASALLVKAAWAAVLTRADPDRLSPLCPPAPGSQSYGWSLATGELIERLRNTLADGGYSVHSVLETHADALPELGRWQAIADLETEYLSRLADLGMEDPCHNRLAYASSPELPEDIRRVVLACVPDPAPLALRALEHIAGSRQVDILVAAPTAEQARFDEWGRPQPDVWSDVPIEIPDFPHDVVLAQSPRAQAECVLAALAKAPEQVGPEDVGIGVPDRTVIPFLQARLAAAALATFDPADKALRESPLYALLDAFVHLTVDRSYPAFSALLRHPAMLEHLLKKHGLKTEALLRDTDEFQNRTLPVNWTDIERHLGAAQSGETGDVARFPSLAAAVAVVRDWLANADRLPPAAAIRNFLRTLYSVRELQPGKPEDDAFRAAAQAVDDSLRELESDAVAQLDPGRENSSLLLSHRLYDITYRREGQQTALDLEGWIELPWNDAALLIVTGMNERFVPGGRMADVFLPDSLRDRLGLDSIARRFARDAFIATILLRTRTESGQVHFVVGKTSASGDPLRPSRLLFQCADEELPARTAHLFGAVAPRRPTPRATQTFLLRPEAVDSLRPADLDVHRFSVTTFRDYLRCPFRFFLKHVLRMSTLNDQKREPDALDFGSMIHDVLENMARDPRLCTATHPDPLGAALCEMARQWIAARFGPDPALPVLVALHSAEQRLRAAAAVQTQLVRDGWELVHSEQTLTVALADAEVRGRIDRIDVHRDTNRVRIIDYKTSDRAARPIDTHLSNARPDTPDFALVELAGKTKRWTDLQLPLYQLLTPATLLKGNSVELAYFNLPKAIADTGVQSWAPGDTDVIESATTCATHILERIRARTFWPPAEKVAFQDDIDAIFTADPAQQVDGAAFQSFIEAMHTG